MYRDQGKFPMALARANSKKQVADKSLLGSPVKQMDFTVVSGVGSLFSWGIASHKAALNCIAWLICKKTGV